MNTSISKKMASFGWTRPLVALLFIAFLVSNAKAQSKSSNDGNEIYTAVEHSAEFPGGTKAFSTFLVKNLHYPAEARKNNVQGKVYLNFVVEKDGSLSDIKVVRGLGSGCDEEAVRAVKLSPKWTPGTQDGRVVRQHYTMPISFTLAKTVQKP